MFKLASEIGKVEEIAYDPKVSHTKDYISALVKFNVNNPAKAARKFNMPEGGTVTIEFEYEKIHKRFFLLWSLASCMVPTGLVPWAI